MSEDTKDTAAPAAERRFEKKDYYGWRCPDSWARSYLALCQKAVEDDEVFTKFRSSVQYGTILEHVPYDLSDRYLKNTFVNNRFLVDQIEKFTSANDKVGSPKIHTYEIANYKKFQASATTLRYVKVLSDLITLFGSLKGLNIVEIGAGYGGLATVIKAQFPYNMYYNVDLSAPGALAKKYTSSRGIDNFISLTPEQLNELEDVKIDLLISNYAFSECNRETREIYINKILSKATMGYITHNGDDERRNETKSFIEKYDNFKIFDRDLADRVVKQHPIFVWDSQSIKEKNNA